MPRVQAVSTSVVKWFPGYENVAGLLIRKHSSSIGSRNALFAFWGLQDTIWQVPGLAYRIPDCRGGLYTSFLRCRSTL